MPRNIHQSQLLDHPALFRQFPTSVARWLSPVDMRATETQLKAFREFALKGDELADQLIAEMAPRRVAETAVWWMEVTDKGGLERFALGFKDILRVRIVHAQIRAGMARNPEWNYADWDAPINQPQMAGTQLLFSLVGLLGLRVMGFRFTDEEIDAVCHLWRYAGLLNGVHRDLLPADEADAWRLLWLIAYTEFAPDEDSRKLATALTGAPPQLHGIHGDNPLSRLAAWLVIGYHSAFSRLVFGKSNADALGLPNQPLFLIPVLGATATTFALETVRKTIPGATALSARVGHATRKFAIEKLAPALRPNRSYTRETTESQKHVAPLARTPRSGKHAEQRMV